MPIATRRPKKCKKINVFPCKGECVPRYHWKTGTEQHCNNGADGSPRTYLEWAKQQGQRKKTINAKRKARGETLFKTDKFGYLVNPDKQDGKLPSFYRKKAQKAKEIGKNSKSQAIKEKATLVAAKAEKVAQLIEEKQEFNWSQRTSSQVLNLPFEEGPPTQEKAKEITKWIKDKAKLSPMETVYVKMYHATDPSLPIEEEGLLPTSATRRRSYQSTSGYVYLANTPKRADMFGKMGNQGRSTVYEVIIPVKLLLPDKDQLNNQRAVGNNVKDSIGESIVYGGGGRFKGKIAPWMIRKMDRSEFDN